MPNKKDARHGPLLLVLFLLLAFSVTGCELIVEEPRAAREDAQRVAMSTAVAELPEYEVAVSAIDFDPPLRREVLQNTHAAVKLLAAVENKGTMPLTQLVVEARVTSQKGEFSAQDRVRIDRLSPGETKVVEFGGVAPVQMLPKSPSYRVMVAVESQQPSLAFRNSSREVIIRVVDSPLPE